MPTIADIDVIPLEYAVPSDQAYGTARNINFKRSCPLLTITTADGVTGYGEVSAPTAVARAYLATLKPFYLGRTIYDVPMVAEYVRSKLYHFGDGHFTDCLSGLDIAAHDAIGKTLKVPLHNLIGGRRDAHVPCYATTGYFTRDGMAGLEAQLVKVDKSIFAGVKIKIGANPKSDRERVRLAREIIGDDLLLMVDVNGNYTADIALESVRAIEPYNIAWFEEPLPSHDLAGHAELRSRSPIPIATGESLHSIGEFKRLIDARGADILQPSLMKCGGFTGAKAIATLVDAAHLRLVPGCWGSAVVIAAAIHFIASRPAVPHTDNIPYPTMLEYDIADNPLRDRLTKAPILPERLGVAVPTGPGLGIEIDQQALATFR